jgi:hypothetical protein
MKGHHFTKGCLRHTDLRARGFWGLTGRSVLDWTAFFFVGKSAVEFAKPFDLICACKLCEQVPRITPLLMRP